MSDSPGNILAALLVGSTLKYGIAAWMRWRDARCFKLVGRVSALYIFPVKSFRGISVEKGELTQLGLKHAGVTDRHWVVSTKDGTWVTQRQESTMALITTEIMGGNLQLDAPGMTPILLPINPVVDPARLSKVTVKTDTVQSLDCGDEVARWLDKYLGRQGLRLHFTAPSLEKRECIKAPKEWKHASKEGDLTAFTDFCSYMTMSNKSLDALNERLTKPVPMVTFRANIIVDGCPPFAEDNWRVMKIGKATFRQLDACTRCVLTTVDQYTGVKSKDEEPLKTLKTFRLKEPYGQKPALGVNMALDGTDCVTVGDLVYAISGQF